MRRSALIMLLCVAVALSFVATAGAATITPTRFDDPPGIGSCPANCSLRQAIGFAQSGDRIQLAAGSYVLSQGIALNVPVIALSIAGVSARSTLIDANQTSGVINNLGTLELSDLTITHGRAQGYGGISNDGTLNLFRVNVDANTAVGVSFISGGGIGNSGNLVVNRSTFLNNEARSTNNSSAEGGAIKFYTGSQATIVNSTFAGNFTTTTSSQGGGGALNVSVGSSADIYNSTFVGNSVNSAQQGGQLYTSTGAVMILRNSVIAGGSGQPAFDNCQTLLGTVTSAGGNIETTTPSQCSLSLVNGDLIGVNPDLTPLADHGGPTDSFMLNPGSPAIGTGVLATCQNTNAAVAGTDQRGGRRIVGGKCDPGATQSNSLADLALTGTLSAPRFGKPVAFTLAMTNKGPDAVLGASIPGTSCSTGLLAVGAGVPCSGTFKWDGRSQISKSFVVSGDFNNPVSGGGQLTLTALSPRFTKLSLYPSRFTPAPKGGVLAAAKSVGGAKITYRAVDVSKVSALVQRPTIGFLKAGRCKARSGTNKSGKRCKLWKSVGKAGSKKLKSRSGTIRLTGRVGKQSLVRGRYRVALTPSSSNGTKGETKYLAFRVR